MRNLPNTSFFRAHESENNLWKLYFFCDKLLTSDKLNNTLSFVRGEAVQLFHCFASSLPPNGFCKRHLTSVPNETRLI